MKARLALLLALLPSVALAQCNPSPSPTGSIGCQPSLSPAQPSDLILVWRPSVFPNSLGQAPLSDIMPSGVNCSGAPSSSFATVNGVVTHC